MKINFLIILLILAALLSACSNSDANAEYCVDCSDLESYPNILIESDIGAYYYSSSTYQENVDDYLFKIEGYNPKGYFARYDADKEYSAVVLVLPNTDTANNYLEALLNKYKESDGKNSVMYDSYYQIYQLLNNPYNNVWVNTNKVILVQDGAILEKYIELYPSSLQKPIDE